VAQSPVFIQMMFELLTFDSNLIKQYTLALLGDAVKLMSDLFRGCIAQFLQVAIQYIEYDQSKPDSAKQLTVCNNACWFIGQVIDSRVGDQVRPYADLIAQKIVTILKAQSVSAPI